MLLLIKVTMLDIYHLSQHVHETAKCCLGETQNAKDWVATRLKELKESGRRFLATAEARNVITSKSSPKGSPMAERTLRVLGFAGSLRQGSFNRSLIRAAQELAPPDMAIDIFDIGGIPLYNADVEAQGEPEAVRRFKESIRVADGVLIATPEYNHGVPGVTKNAIDWASRPPHQAPLNRKPVGILGASPGLTGSARGQSQLRQAFEFTNSYCMPQPEVLVFHAHEKFDAQGKLTDEKTRDLVGKYLAALAEWIGHFAV